MSWHSPGMPRDPAQYEAEYEAWPWGRVLAHVRNIVAVRAPVGAVVMDYMCGTGYLLAEIRKIRPDLRLVGCTLESAYIEYGRSKYEGLELYTANVLHFLHTIRPDLAICTAGIHHLDKASQPLFVAGVARQLQGGSAFIVAEEVIGPHSTEAERKLALVDLCSGIMAELVKCGAPWEQFELAFRVLRSDFNHTEWKCTRSELARLAMPYFSVQSSETVWPPTPSAYGDVVEVWVRNPTQEIKNEL